MGALWFLLLLAAAWVGLGAGTARAQTPDDPREYLASLYFDGEDGGGGEQFFPLAGSGMAVFPDARLFNASQDGNGDGLVDVEDALENVVPARIGSAVRGVGATGLADRGPNDQRPAVYFWSGPLPRWPGWTVAGYWLYYAAEDGSDRIEHDWEAYLIYFYEGRPERVRLTGGGDARPVYRWQEFVDRGLVEGGTHLRLSVERGTHAFRPPDAGLEDGVAIGWDGSVELRGGVLSAPPPVSSPWVVLGSDAAEGTLSFQALPPVYGIGDPAEGSQGADRLLPAPWSGEWQRAPRPFDRVFADVGQDSPVVTAVESLWQDGVLDGYLVGAQPTFHPDDPALRAQFAKATVLAFGPPPAAGQSTPPVGASADAASASYPDGYVATAAAAGILNGRGDGEPALWDALTRAQAITMVVRGLEAFVPAGLHQPPPGYEGSLTSADPAHAPAVRTAEFNGLLAGMEGLGEAGDLWGTVSRGEAAALIWLARERVLPDLLAAAP